MEKKFAKTLLMVMTAVILTGMASQMADAQPVTGMIILRDVGNSHQGSSDSPKTFVAALPKGECSIVITASSGAQFPNTSSVSGVSGPAAISNIYLLGKNGNRVLVKDCAKINWNGNWGGLVRRLLPSPTVLPSYRLRLIPGCLILAIKLYG